MRETNRHAPQMTTIKKKKEKLKCTDFRVRWIDKSAQE